MAITDIIGGVGALTTIIHPATVCYIKSEWDDDWKWLPYLYAKSATLDAMPNVSTAELAYEYGSIKREYSTVYEDFDPISLRGQYVKICKQDDWGELPLWYGVIEEEDVSDNRIRFRAFDLSHMLDRIGIEGSLTENGWIDRTISFNRREGRGHVRIGNRSAAVNADGIFVHSNNTDLWTNRQIIDHILKSYLPTNITFQLSGLVDSLDEIIGEYEFYGCTVKEAIDTLIDRKRGLGSCIYTDGSGTIYIYVFSTVAQDIAIGDFLVKGNYDVLNCDFSESINVRPTYTYSNIAQFDKVIVRGGPLYSTFTASFTDGTLEAGWTAEEEAAYQAGTGNPADPAEEHDVARQSEALSNVYCKFRIPDSFNWTITNSGITVNVAPGFRDDGTIDPLIFPVAWNYGHVFERELPYLEPTGITDSERENRKPFAIVQTTPTSCQYVDKLSLDGKDYNVSLYLSDREMAFILNPTFNHLFAKNHWSESTAAASQFTPALDYEDIFFTGTVMTDSMLRVEAYVDNADVSDVQRVKVIADQEDARADWISQFTISDIVNGGTVNEASSYAYRNDIERLQAIAAYAAAWYSLQRATATIEQYGITDAFLPGQIIQQINDKDCYHNLGTVITAISWDFVSCTTTIQTGYEELRFTDAGKK